MCQLSSDWVQRLKRALKNAPFLGVLDLGVPKSTDLDSAFGLTVSGRSGLPSAPLPHRPRLGSRKGELSFALSAIAFLVTHTPGFLFQSMSLICRSQYLCCASDGPEPPNGHVVPAPEPSKPS